MGTQVTVTLPDDVLQRAELLAQRTGKALADVLAETIELSLLPLGSLENGDKSFSACSDDEVLAATETAMEPAEDRRLSELLDRQQADLLISEQRSELTALMQRYQMGLLRKALALEEAVRRGLRGPLQP